MNSFPTCNLGFRVKYLLVISIWWRWHIWTGIFSNKVNNPLRPSRIIDCISMPLLLIVFMQILYNSFVSYLIYCLYKSVLLVLSLKHITPKFLQNKSYPLQHWQHMENACLSEPNVRPTVVGLCEVNSRILPSIPDKSVSFADIYPTVLMGLKTCDL